MKSYKVVEFGKPMQKVEEPTPTPKGTEVVVRITAAGVCHSDVHLWEGYFDMGGGNKYSTAKTMNPPRTMGHEIVGEVAAVGPDAKGAKIGDKALEIDGSYSIKGDVITTTIEFGGKKKTESSTIKKLTDKELYDQIFGLAGGSLSATGIGEVAVLDQQTTPGGSMMARVVLSPVVNKTTSDKLKITYKCRIT